MSMTRRNFLQGMLATAVAPAIVKAEHIMRIRPPESGLLVPDYKLSIGTVQVYESHFGAVHVSMNRYLKQIADRTAAMERDRREQLLEALYNIGPAEVPFTARVAP